MERIRPSENVEEASKESIAKIVQERIKPEWIEGIPFNEQIIDTPLEVAAITIIRAALADSNHTFGPSMSKPIDNPLTVWEYQKHRLQSDSGAALLSYPSVYFGAFKKEDTSLWGVTIEPAQPNTPKAELVAKLSEGFSEAGFPLTPSKNGK